MTDTAQPSPRGATPPRVPILLRLLEDADVRLVRTVDGLSPEELAHPSLLPGWSRAHVVAHLALNAEALQGVLDSVARREHGVMYASPEARDADIEELAAVDAAVLRERFLSSVHLFDKAASAVAGDGWKAHFDRTPGGQVIAVRNVPLMRLREVEIHHADLGAGYSAADWPEAFDEVLIESMTKRPYPQPFRVLARDLARTWDFGDGEPATTVTGDAAALAWWLTGRGDGTDLTTDTNRLPEVPSW